jgi:flagellar hook-basal body complex protein FliE
MVASVAAAAINAYASAQAQADKAGGITGGGGDVGGLGFGDMVKQFMGDAISTSQNAEKVMSAQTQGKAELIDAVTAISSAETSMQTVMAVRDQVISAYQEIMRMPI